MSLAASLLALAAAAAQTAPQQPAPRPLRVVAIARAVILRPAVVDLRRDGSAQPQQGGAIYRQVTYRGGKVSVDFN